MIAGWVAISMQRTIRVPEDGKTYPLPPGLGRFPLWERSGVYCTPVYQREALWIEFQPLDDAWTAIQVGAGGINALTGEPFPSPLRAEPQNYLVCPEQPWLDGILAGKSVVRQFVAAPLGSGLTISEQMQTTQGARDRLEMRVFGARKKLPAAVPRLVAEIPVGLGAGGRIEQKIYPDPHGLDAWETEPLATVKIRLLNSTQWKELTGQEPPPTPVSARDYSDWSLPWFELYDEDAKTLESTGAFDDVTGITNGDESVEPRRVKGITRKLPPGESR